MNYKDLLKELIVSLPSEKLQEAIVVLKTVARN